MNKEKPSRETLEQWHRDPSNWKLGVFYYNKKDNRIFPPKRFRSLGWTVNFGNPRSYLAFVFMMVLLAIVLHYIK